MLYELFSWLNGSVDNSHLNNKILDESEFKKELDSATETWRKLLADVRVKHLDKSSSEASVSESLTRLSQHESYLKFVDFCKIKFNSQDKNSTLLLGIEYLLSQYNSSGKNLEIHANKITYMFSIALARCNEISLDFYHKNMGKFPEKKEIEILMTMDKTNRFLSLLSSRLKGQKDPLDIVFLFGELIVDTEEFAASLLWLLRQNVSVKDILKTNLLQYFMLYNLGYLHADDSPIIDLYSLLYHYSEAGSLIKEAGKIRCEERGFQSYALTGVLCDEKKLESISVCPRAIQFTSSSENFDALNELFGQTFLLAALEWCAYSDNQVFFSRLCHVLNKDLSIEKLSIFINQVAASVNGSVLLKKVTPMLADNTMEGMISKNQGAILHLLSYKPGLCKKISEINVKDFVSHVNKSGISPLEIVPQLMAMFSAFKGVNENVTQVVYEAIINTLMMQPQLLDDDLLLKRLKRYDGKHIILAHKFGEIESQLTATIDSQIVSLPFTEKSYGFIEDVWSSSLQKIDFINELAPELDSFPHDKYTFQAKIAAMIFLRHGNKFNLDNFTKALEVEPSLEQDSVTTYERLLIEVLTTIDEDLLRGEIIEKLKGKYKEDIWVVKKYGEESVFNRAAKLGNVGFLTWLELKTRPNRKQIGLLALQAAKSNQWRVVDYFCQMQANKPEQCIIDEIFVLATAQGEINSAMLLCDPKLNHLHKKVVEKGFLEAILNNHTQVVKFICSLTANVPCDAILVKGFKQAVRDGQWDIVQCIGGLSNHLLLESEINRTFLNVCARADIKLIQIVMGLLSSVTESMLDDALKVVTNSSDLQIIKYICETSFGMPSQHAIELALVQAIKLNNPMIVDYFCSLKINTPRQHAVEKAMQLAAKLGHLDIIHCLLALSGENAPRTTAKDNALLIASSFGQTKIVNNFCRIQGNKLSQGFMNQALQSAVQSGHLPTVQCLFDSGETTPGKTAVQSAIKKASKSGYKDIVGYLKHLIKGDEKETDLSKESYNSSQVGALNVFGLFAAQQPDFRSGEASSKLAITK